MNEMMLKQFEGIELRIHIDENGNPWFASQDVMKALDLKSQRHALRKLKNEERGVFPIPSPSGLQEYSMVSESGLYSLIFESKKPAAKEFQRWITSEVIPSIRKTGSYSLIEKKDLSPLDILENHVRQMRALEKANIDMSVQIKAVAIEAKQDHDTLTYDQIKFLGDKLDSLYLINRDHKDASRAMKLIKNKFNLTNRNTWKEMPRHGFGTALEIVETYREYLQGKL